MYSLIILLFILSYGMFFFHFLKKSYYYWYHIKKQHFRLCWFFVHFVHVRYSSMFVSFRTLYCFSEGICVCVLFYLVLDIYISDSFEETIVILLFFGPPLCFGSQRK